LEKTWFNYLNLSDEYERRARLIPGILTILPLLPLSAAYGGPMGDWVQVLLIGLGVGAVVSVGISHLASALGNRMQRRLWPEWPHDSPTNRWLHPDDKTISRQQKERWYKAIKRVVGIDIEAIVRKKDREEMRLVINDAVKAVRGRLWKAPEADRMRLYNTDYGFARNLAGLRPVWTFLAVGSALGCWVGYIWFERPVIWCIVSTVIAIGALLFGFFILPGYVRQKAHFYAEGFFESLVAFDESRQPERP
jgi:hypothetical protein